MPKKNAVVSLSEGRLVPVGRQIGLSPIGSRSFFSASITMGYPDEYVTTNPGSTLGENFSTSIEMAMTTTTINHESTVEPRQHR